MPKYKLILLDFDNTLVDSNSFVSQFTQEFLNSQGINQNADDFFSKVNQRDADLPQDLVDKYWKQFVMAQKTDLKLYPEDKGALARLVGTGVKLGIISRSDKIRVENSLSQNGVSDLFSVVEGRVDKPNPEILLKILNNLGVSKEDVLYVGDDKEDIELGQNAGVATAYILRSNPRSQQYYSNIKDWLETNKPDYLITSLEELTHQQ